MLADADIAAERLHRLKALGVRIAMDDFGTGYSSLSYLSRLPVDIIKMDRSFLGGGIDDNGLAAAIMAIGERLGLEVVAEGIERRDQIDSLQSLGFGLGQGFLFGRPMPQGPLNDIPERPRRVDLRAVRLRCSITSRVSTGQAARPASDCCVRSDRVTFALLWTGMTASLVGDGIFLVAIAWTAYSLWNTPVALSVVGIAMTVPTIACLLVGGVISDRFDRRRVMLWSDLGRGLAVGLLAFLAITHGSTSRC